MIIFFNSIKMITFIILENLCPVLVVFKKIKTTEITFFSPISLKIFVLRLALAFKMCLPVFNYDNFFQFHANIC